jgi:hypothetical protein
VLRSPKITVDALSNFAGTVPVRNNNKTFWEWQRPLDENMVEPKKLRRKTCGQFFGSGSRSVKSAKIERKNGAKRQKIHHKKLI